MGSKVELTSGVSGAYSSIYNGGYGRVDVTYSPLISQTVGPLGGWQHPNFKQDDLGLFTGEVAVFGIGGELSTVYQSDGGFKLTVAGGVIAQGEYTLEIGDPLSPSTWTHSVNGFISYDLKLSAGIGGFGAGAGVGIRYDDGVSKINAFGDVAIIGIRGELSQETARSLSDLAAPWFRAIAKSINPMNNANFSGDQCFERSTKISVGDGKVLPISEISPGMSVLAFDPTANKGRGELVARTVTRVFRNTTKQFFKLSWGGDEVGQQIHCTPGHHFLDILGNFPPIEAIIADGRATVVLQSGEVVEVKVERFDFSADTSDLFERAFVTGTSDGRYSMELPDTEAWQTYNFEVEELHTYVAGGVRVHNSSYAWAHDAERGLGLKTALGAIRNGVPADYAVRLGRAVMGYENVGGSNGQAVAYTASGRAITLDRKTYDDYIDSHGGKYATPQSRGAAVATTAISGGYSAAAARAAAVKELQLAGGTADGANIAFLDRKIEQYQTGSSGKGNVAAPKVSTQSSSLSGTSSSPSGTTKSTTVTAPKKEVASTGSSGKSGGGGDPQPTNKSSETKSKTGSKSGGKGRSGKPVLFDLDDSGIEVVARDDSSFFFDISNDGYLHRSAWAGVGDGVLVIDADSDGKISNRKEVVLTDWDPSADSDMEALRQVFDTNGNGLLDAGDANWLQFKVMVTKPDGTTVMKTLGELGIQSLTLVADETRYEFADGSSIDGEATFTRADGTTGKAATASLMIDASGYAVSTSATVDADQNTVLTTKALNKDGSLASETVRTTSADGLSVTTRFDNDGDGVIDRVLTDVTEVLSDGTKRRTETSRNGAGVLIGSMVTQTSADRTLIQIDRDQLGGGFTTESETQQTSGDGSLTITISKKAADGSVISSERTEFSGDRLSRTDSIDLDGNLAYERSVTSQTVKNADGSITKRDNIHAGNGELLAETVVAISADGLVRSETVDLNGDGLLDRSVAGVTTRNAISGATEIVEQTNARDGSLVSKASTAVSSDGLSKVVSSDADGDSVFDRVVSDVTVIAADQSRTQTVATHSASGALLSNTVTVRAADGLTGSKSIDGDGDGSFEQVTTVAKATDGQTVQTSQSYSADGTLLSKSVSTTSVDGLSTTVRNDRYGLGTDDQILTEVTVKNADGSAQQTVEPRSGSNSLLQRTVVTESANGLVTRTQADSDGDGVHDRDLLDSTVVGSDGSQTRTIETRSGNGALLTGETIVTSHDRLLVTRTVDVDGDGQANVRQVSQTTSDGAKTTTEEILNDLGQVISRKQTTASANGLVQATTQDVDGNGIVDGQVSAATVLGMDGGKTTTSQTMAGDGTLLRADVTSHNGNGSLVIASSDLNGDGVVDLSTRSETTLNADGSTTVTVTQKSGSSVASVKTSTQSANGLSSLVASDLDGDGDIDQTVQNTKQLLGSGGVVETQQVRAQDLTLVSGQTVERSANGRLVTTTLDRNGDGNVDETRLREVLADGSVRTTTTGRNAAGAVTSTATETVSRNGLETSVSIDSNGDGTVDRTKSTRTEILADGSQRVTRTEYSGTSTLVERSVTTTSGNGLQSSTIWSDATGATTRSHERLTVLAQDGSKVTTETFRKADGSLESMQTLSQAGNGNSTILTRDINGDGKLDDRITESSLDNGTTTRLHQNLKADGTVSAAKLVTTSADELTVTTLYDGTGDGTYETRVVSKSEPLADGSSRTTVTQESLVSGAWQLKGKTVTTTSGDGLNTSKQWDDTGAGTFGLSRTSQIVLGVDGSRVATDRTLTNGITTRIDEHKVSADGLTITERTDLNGDGTFDQTSTDVTVLNANGSRTRTETATKAGGSTISSRVTTVSKDGLSTSVAETSNVAGWAARTTSVVMTLLADGSSRTVKSVKNASGQLIESETVDKTADGRTVVTEYDRNGDGVVDQRAIETRFGDGRVSLVKTNYGAAGGVVSSVVSATSESGLRTTIETDDNGDGVIDVVRTTERRTFADGSSNVLTTIVNAATNAVKSRTEETVSADGTLRLESTDVNGDGIADQMVREELLPSGIRKTTVTNNAAAKASSEIRAGELYWGDTIPSSVETTVSADGLTRNIRMDIDGNGVFEVTATAVTQIDGSVITSIVETNADGSVKARGELAQSHDGRLSVLGIDSNNDGVKETTVTTSAMLDGSVVKVAIKRNTSGVVTETTTSKIDALGDLLSTEILNGAGQKLQDYVRENDGFGTLTTYVPETGSTKSIDLIDPQMRVYKVSLRDPKNEAAWSKVDFYMNEGGQKDVEIQYLDSGVIQGFSYSGTTVSAQNISLSFVSDRLIGAATADLLVGGQASEIISGNAGEDWIFGGRGGDTISGGDGNDVIHGELGDDALNGDAGNDHVFGGAGADTLDGGAGTDTLNGGGDNDTYVLGDGTDTVIDSGGIDTITSTISRSLASYGTIENLTLLGTSNINATGNALDNVLTGNSGVNALNGGAGNDTYVLDGGNDSVTDSSGIDTITSTISRNLTSYSAIENLTLLGTADASATGNALNNLLMGNAGNNILDGGVGSDSLVGGAGDDTFVLGNGSDSVSDSSGNDTITSTVSRDLRAYYSIENVLLRGEDNIDVTGNALDNFLTGNNGNNILDGGAGADVLNGGSGDDTFVLGDGADTVLDNHGIDTATSTISRNLGDYGGAIENLVLLGTDNINATGAGLENVLVGNTGNNILDGDTGDDTLIGGAGNDTYVLADEFDTVEDESGVDTITSTISRNLSYYSAIENLTLVGDSDVGATGNSSDNLLTGNAGNNVLDGGLGADTLFGGDGHDTYVLSDGYDFVEDSGGTDTATSTINRSLEVFGSIENLTLLGSENISGAGNALSNVLMGNSGDNSLDGGAGDDKLLGGAGHDFIQGGEGADFISSGDNVVWQTQGSPPLGAPAAGSASSIDADQILGGGGDDIVVATDGADFIEGDSGDDRIYGLAGNDNISGGDGNDVIWSDFISGDLLEGEVFGSNFLLTAYHTEEDEENRDTVDGGGGDDRIYSGRGNDDVSGGSGRDIVAGDAGDDKIDGGSGSDYIFGDAYFALLVDHPDIEVDYSGDLYSFGFFALSQYLLSVDENGGINYSNGDNYDREEWSEGNEFGLELDPIWVWYNSSIENGSYTFDDTLSGGDGDDYISGDFGNDQLDGGSGSDILVGGAGNDTLAGGTNLDFYFGDDGDDTILISSDDFVSSDFMEDRFYFLPTGLPGLARFVAFGGNGRDTLIFEGPEDFIFIFDGYEFETVHSSTGNDKIFGDGSSNEIWVSDGDDYVYGADGDDIIYGEDGNDLIEGGEGDDTLYGGGGSDLFLYVRRDGSDTLGDFSASSGDKIGIFAMSFGISVEASISDYVMLDGVATGSEHGYFLIGATGVSWDADGTGSADAVQIITFQNPVAGLDHSSFQFYDRYMEDLYVKSDSISVVGDCLANEINLATGDDFGSGGGGDDVIKGGVGDDIIVGGVGDDTLFGGAGADLFHYAWGDGLDALGDFAPSLGDRIDIDAGSFGITSGNVVSDYVVLDGSSPDSDHGYFLVDANGVSWDSDGTGAEEAVALMVLQGNDTAFTHSNFLFSKFANEIFLSPGDDQAEGTQGRDIIHGDAGDDIISGGDGDDIIEGGLGDDTLTGGMGANRFVYAWGDGLDTITDFYPGLGDVIEFRPSSFGLSIDASAVEYFRFGGTAPDANHGYFLVSGTGVVWDQNGSGLGGETQLLSYQGDVQSLGQGGFVFGRS